MKIKCDFCKQEIECEVVMCDSKDGARERPKNAGAIFPWNAKKLPKGTTFSKESLKKAGIVTRCACPNCYR